MGILNIDLIFNMGFYMFRHSLLLSAVAFGFVFCTQAPANAADTLTKVSIEKFYQDVEKIQTAGEKKLLGFYEKHTRDDMILTMKSTVNIEGMPPQKAKDVMNKKQMLEATVEGLEAGQMESVEYKLVGSEIAENGMSANTRSTVFTEMIITVPTPEGDLVFDSETVMFCDDQLALSDKGIIQIVISNCTNETSMKPLE